MSRVDDMPGYIVALITSAALCTVAFFLNATGSMPDGGVCLPSVGEFMPSPWVNTVAAFALLWLISSLMTTVNRKFNLEAGTSALASSFFLVSTASVPVLVSGLNGGLLMAMAAIISLWLMFSAFEKANTTRTTFLCATMVAFGSMIQGGFILFIVPLVIAAISLREFSIRSAIAFIFGLLTPYLLMVGFGVVSLASFRIPNIVNSGYTPHYTTIIAGGATALAAIILLLRQAVILPTRSSRATAMNRSVNLMLLFTIAMAAVDYRNMTVYLPTINLLTGFEISGIVSDTEHSSPTPVLAVLTIIYLTLYILAL